MIQCYLSCQLLWPLLLEVTKSDYLIGKERDRYNGGYIKDCDSTAGYIFDGDFENAHTRVLYKIIGFSTLKVLLSHERGLGNMFLLVQEHEEFQWGQGVLCPTPSL